MNNGGGELAVFQRHLELWIDHERTVKRCMASHENVLSRLRLLQKGCRRETTIGDDERDERDERNGDIACDVFEAIPDPVLRQRLEEVHSAEVMRVERLIEKFLFELEESLTKMTQTLDDIHAEMEDEVTIELSCSEAGETSRGAMPSSSSSSSPPHSRNRSYKGGQNDRAGANKPSAAHKAVVSLSEFEWMSDVVRMLSFELWRKEEIVASVLRCVREGRHQALPSKKSAISALQVDVLGGSESVKKLDAAEAEAALLAYARNEFLSSSSSSFVDWSRLQEHRKPKT
mmetsp:Transcript_55177/g.110801  ORF Transcript_55177/g.110801 Transcript_55177/m.110801 type:complete len:288 (-) Transcript_55177:51-914(-)